MMANRDKIADYHRLRYCREYGLKTETPFSCKGDADRDSIFQNTVPKPPLLAAAAPDRFQLVAKRLAYAASVGEPHVYVIKNTLEGFYPNVVADSLVSFVRNNRLFNITFSDTYRLADGTLMRANVLPIDVVAGIIAHEIGHFRLGHLGRKAKNNKESREREYEADLYGTRLLCNAGFPVDGFAEALELLFYRQQVTSPADNHPDTPSRLARLRPALGTCRSSRKF